MPRSRAASASRRRWSASRPTRPTSSPSTSPPTTASSVPSSTSPARSSPASSVRSKGRHGQAALDLVHELDRRADRPRHQARARHRRRLARRRRRPRRACSTRPTSAGTALRWPTASARAAGVPVFVANDANTAALGEHTYGEAEGGGMMVLRIGTGVGAGLILEGSLLHGHRAAAGEIGHVVVDPRGEQCACGRVGCLETLLAVAAPPPPARRMRLRPQADARRDRDSAWAPRWHR